MFADQIAKVAETFKESANIRTRATAPDPMTSRTLSLSDQPLINRRTRVTELILFCGNSARKLLAEIRRAVEKVQKPTFAQARLFCGVGVCLKTKCRGANKTGQVCAIKSGIMRIHRSSELLSLAEGAETQPALAQDRALRGRNPSAVSSLINGRSGRPCGGPASPGRHRC